MNKQIDAQVFSEIQSGNRKLFENLFIKSYEPLCHYAFRIIRDTEAAEEIVQEIFVKFWEEKAALSIHTSINSYLYRSVYNRCINYINHEKIKSSFSNTFLLENKDLISPFSSDYPTANLLMQELSDTINKAIQELPEQCREIFIKVRQEEMSYAEVAEALEISVNTVKTQLQRAMAKLRTTLQEYLP